MENSNLHLKIREERIKQGLSQKELGEKVGLPQQAINRIEQGQRKLDIELFEKLCKALKITKIGSFSVNLISSYYQTEPITISEYEQQQKEETAKKAPKSTAYDENGNEIKDEKTPKFTSYSTTYTPQEVYELIHSLIDKEEIDDREREDVSQQLKKILSSYKGLNEIGRKKAVERIEELYMIPKYVFDNFPDNIE